MTGVLELNLTCSRAKEVRREVGIRDVGVKAHPVNWLTPEAQDPETKPHLAHSGCRDPSTAFHWESPTKEIFAHGIW